jgi:RNA polymerase sigma-70 factor, ECF subfamily
VPDGDRITCCIYYESVSFSLMARCLLSRQENGEDSIQDPTEVTIVVHEVLDMAVTNLTRERKRTSDPREPPESKTRTIPWRNRPPGLKDPLFKNRFRIPVSPAYRSEGPGPLGRAPTGNVRQAEPAGQPDGWLVEQCLAGQREAYAELVQRYQHTVFRIALGLMRDREEAEDLAQETFVQAYRKLSTFDERYRFRNWILTICVNQGKNRIRSRVRRRNALERYALEREQATKAPQLPEHDLRRELEKIPESLRMPLLLRHGEGLSYQEVARILKIGTSAAKMRVKRGRDALLRLLQAQTQGGSP